MDAVAAEVVLWCTAVTLAAGVLIGMIRFLLRLGGLWERITELESRVHELETETERHIRKYHRRDSRRNAADEPRP